MSLLAVSTSAVISSVTGGSLAEGAVTVDLDLSLFVHLGFFLVLLFVLKPALFDPMMRLFEERERKIDGTRIAATKEDEKSAKAHTKALAIVAKSRDAGAQERERIRTEGLKREAELMAEVRAEVAATLERGRAEITTEAEAAKKDLRAQSRDLGRDIASRVLGREVAS
jgi:F-type H+-transporting ATPase subunit b